ncbi:uncharacterized protein LOC135710053 [Ochlerotatus camptorhynchus]|uniref:uncharacterized protein LOC135710053 n=1 Tax=Ochlerotatus camptorhynchus TaxID=644619 RepID=UPI0031D13AFF
MATPPDRGSCVACERPDSADDFVQCDECDAWFHFSCAGVTDSVADRAWVCYTCQQSVGPTEPLIPTEPLVPTEPPEPPNPAEPVIPQVLTNIWPRTSITANNLSCLKERQTLVRQRVEIELQKKFLEEQQQLVDDLIAEEDSRSQVNEQERIRIQDWIRDSADVEEGAVGDEENLRRASRIQQQISNPAMNRTPNNDLVKAVRELESRLNGCQQQLNPTQDQMVALMEQLEICKRRIESMHLAGSEQQPSVCTSRVPNRHSFQSMTQSQRVNTSTPLQVRPLGAIPKQKQSEPVEPAELEGARVGKCSQSSCPAISGTTRHRSSSIAVWSSGSPQLQGLIEYGLAVQELCDHIEAADQHDHLANPTLLQELVNKLPADQKMMWTAYKRGLNGVNLKTFVDYMTGVVQDATSVVMYEPDHKKSGGKTKDYVNSHVTDIGLPASSMKVTKPGECINCNKTGHKMRECEAFKSLSVDERWRRIRSLGVCQICLFGHGKRSCRSESRCNVSGCQYRHHPLLHGRSPVQSIPRVAENYTHSFFDSSVLFRIIPVTLHGSSGRVNTFAFLDEGSSLTLIEGGLVAQLGVRGRSQPLCLRWTGNTSRVEKNSQVVTVVISGVGQKRQFKLANARTVGNLNLPSQSFDYDQAAEQHPYLRQLPVQSYQGAVPKILIGLDNLRLALPLKVREGDGTGPSAVKTRLGWCVYGQQKERLTEGYSFHVCECETSSELHETIKQFFAVEANGAIPVQASFNKEEERAQRLLEQTTRRIGAHFETGLIWKQDDINLPNSYAMAVRRMQCLERKLERDPALNENFHRQIQEYQNKGYAHRAMPEELQKADPGRTWYLPLGVVTNPNKPGKVRVIWDASAKVGGVSLNSMLLKGPDQLTALPAVLFRFRQFWVAVNADIKEMFHQIFMREEDKCALCFLYRKDKTQPLEVFIMDVATFGATCSPASAQFVKNLNAKEHADQFPRAAEGILRSHYVDDYLDSFGTVEEAKKVAEEVRHVHRNGGFHLRNWNSNCDEILRHLGETKAVECKNLYMGVGESTERVLGMLWKPSTDDLCFSTRMSDEVRDLIASGNVPTKRQVLRCVMTLFDPLGLLAPFLIHGKVLIQDLWRAGTDWDEAIGDAAYDRWRRWVEMIKFVSTVKVPRCYFPRATEDTYRGAQLHVFVDASPTAYSCAVYLRAKDGDGVIRCALVAGKAKVAPLKPMSIPRLELQACVLGTRVLKFVQENHTIRVEKRVLWTDSTTVWHWIRSDPRNFKPFVAHRVGEILENTNAAEWKWIRSRFNSADEATKWGCGPYFSDESKWYDGPKFLHRPEQDWPSTLPPSMNTTEEIRASVLHHAAVERIIDYERFSSWDRLHRTLAYVLRFLRNAAKKQPIRKGQLEQHELLAAEVTILKLVQWESYPDEKNILQRNEGLPVNEKKPLDKSSRIYELVPVIDEDGLLRQYGRIGAAKGISYDMCYPVILPREHWVTRLVVEKYHRKYRHANTETIVNEIRQVFAISKLRSLVKNFARSCMMCILRKAHPNIPPMAPLPPARLAIHARPFSHVALDYFGPLLVKVGRSSVKRWIALFTCLTVRAVHLEVAFSLSTSSCISCVRRFVGRRGSPIEFISDNGTNFQGAERLLREQISQGLSSSFTNSSTRWTFIPPGAPHMGGAWERLVQSVKKAMMDAYSEGKLDDEGLQTLVVEAESIVNSRPLTYLPLDSAESEALTPNHFLMGSSSGANQPNVVPGQPQHRLKDMWDQIQLKLDRFWYRWTVEYLPVIRRQSKWFAEVRPLQEGDLVLIVNDSERNNWMRGRVVQTFVGADGRVRQAKVQTSGGILRRPAAKLALLDVGSRSAVFTYPKMHPGEDVDAAAVELAALPTDRNGSAHCYGTAA